MKDAQFDQLMSSLARICAAVAPLAGPVPQPVQVAPPALKAPPRPDGRRDALQAVLEVLDGWIEDCMSNHEASASHQNENRGEECWRTFTPQDIRYMVNDAARTMGLRPFDPTMTGREDWPL